MKKIVTLSLLLVVFLITGCGKEKYITCNINLKNDVEDYTQNSVYKIYYKNNYVTRIEKNDVYKSEEKSTLDYFNEYKNLEYSNLNDLYGGYSYNIEYINDSINISSVINIENVDLKKMILDGYLSSEYVVSGKLTTSGIQYFYKSKGATCDI